MSTSRQRLILVFLIILPLLFNTSTGDVEQIKVITLSAMAVYLWITKIEFPMRQSVLLWAILILASTGMIASFMAVEPQVAIWGSPNRYFGLWNWLMALLFALYIGDSFSKKTDRTKLVQNLIVSGVIASIAALIVHITKTGEAFDGRLMGTLGNPNVLAKLVLFTLVLTIHQLFKDKKRRPIWAAATILQGFVLIETGSRASLLALIIVGLVYLWKYAKEPLLGTLATSVFIAVVVLVDWERIIDTQTIDTRLELYNASMSAITAHPWIGYGFDHADLALNLPHFTLLPDRAHQLFLDAMLNFGLFGTIAFTILLLGTLQLFLKSKEDNYQILGLALLALIIASQFSFFTTIHLVLFTTCLGLALNMKDPLLLRHPLKLE